MNARREHLELWLQDRADSFLSKLGRESLRIEQEAAQAGLEGRTADDRNAIEIVWELFDLELGETYSGAQAIWNSSEAAMLVAKHLRRLRDRTRPNLTSLSNRKGMNFRSAAAEEIVERQLAEMRIRIGRKIKLKEFDWDRSIAADPNAAAEEYLRTWLERE